MPGPVDRSSSSSSSETFNAADAPLVDVLIHDATENGIVNTQKLAAAVADHSQEEGLFNQIETRLGPTDGGHFARDYAAELIRRHKADGPNDSPAGGARPDLLGLGLRGHSQGRAWGKMANDHVKLSDSDKAKAAIQYNQLQSQISKALNRSDLTVQERFDLEVAGSELFGAATQIGAADSDKMPPALVDLGIAAMANSGGGGVGPSGAGRIPGLREPIITRPGIPEPPGSPIPRQSGPGVHIKVPPGKSSPPPELETPPPPKPGAPPPPKPETPPPRPPEKGLPTSGLKVVPRPGMPSRTINDRNGHPVIIYGQAERSSSTTPGHSEAMNNLVKRLAETGDYEYFTLQLAWRTATGRVAESSLQPDVIGVRRDGTVDAWEVRSKSDSPRALMDRLEKGLNTLPPERQGEIRVIDPEPSTSP